MTASIPEKLGELIQDAILTVALSYPKPEDRALIAQAALEAALSTFSALRWQAQGHPIENATPLLAILEALSFLTSKVNFEMNSPSHPNPESRH